MLDVDVGSTKLDTVGDDRINELDYGCVDSRLCLCVLFLLPDLLDADCLIEFFDQAVNHRVGPQGLLHQLVQLPRRAE